MTEPITLFDFSNIRCQAIVVEYIRNPSGEISPARVFAKRCDRCARQQADKLFQRASGRPNRFPVIRKHEFLSSGQLDIEILRPVPDMRGQARQERKPPEFSFSLFRRR
jgi:hypothetical protein